MGFYSAIYFYYLNAVLNVVLVKTVTSRICSVLIIKKNSRELVFSLTSVFFCFVFFFLCEVEQSQNEDQLVGVFRTL